MGYFINRKARKKTLKHSLNETLLLHSYWSLLSLENVSDLSRSGLTENQELKDNPKCVQTLRYSESGQRSSPFRHKHRKPQIFSQKICFLCTHEINVVPYLEYSLKGTTF